MSAIMKALWQWLQVKVTMWSYTQHSHWIVYFVTGLLIWTWQAYFFDWFVVYIAAPATALLAFLAIVISAVVFADSGRPIPTRTFRIKSFDVAPGRSWKEIGGRELDRLEGLSLRYTFLVYFVLAVSSYSLRGAAGPIPCFLALAWRVYQSHVVRRAAGSPMERIDNNPNYILPAYFYQ